MGIIKTEVDIKNEKYKTHFGLKNISVKMKQIVNNERKKE